MENNRRTVAHARVMEAAFELILSASGWRKIFAAGGAESFATELSPADEIIVGAMAVAFSQAVAARQKGGIVAVATDSRPTGPAIADIIIRVLISRGLEVKFSGVTAVPELLSSVQTNRAVSGFAYVSASHNPVGYNGVKFGFSDGAVAGGEDSAKLIASFKEIIASTEVEAIADLIDRADPTELRRVYDGLTAWKASTARCYADFALRVASDSTDPSEGRKLIDLLRTASQRRKLGVLIDFNGSARAVSIDAAILREAGCLVETMNDRPGEIAHRIVPEGESLEPCRERLARLHKENPAFCIGYVPDNDGDRGNLVYVDAGGGARTVHAQELFALCCVSELSYLDYKAAGARAGGAPGVPPADAVTIAANGPTSMRVDRIASYFGAKVERAEVGEANVVNLARRLREEGEVVRFLGEGSNGGSIIHPATCRDPLNTLFSVLKLLLIGGNKKRPGPFELWCRKSGLSQRYKPGFSLPDVLRTLPLFTTTSAYEERAIMRIKTDDHGLLKERYERLFAERWQRIQQDLLARKFPIERWEIVNYEGTATRPGAGNRDGNGNQRGGLKVILFDNEQKPKAFLWMRGSGTEPVFRVLVDVEGEKPGVEELLLNLHREMIALADNS